jgi:hypothetical protein
MKEVSVGKQKQRNKKLVAIYDNLVKNQAKEVKKNAIELDRIYKKYKKPIEDARQKYFKERYYI